MDPDFPGRDAEWFEPEEQPDNSGALFWLIVGAALSAIGLALWHLV